MKNLNPELLSIRTPLRVWAYTVGLMAVISLAIFIDCYLAYPADFRWQVIQRAVPFSAVVTFVISQFVFNRILLLHQMRQELQLLVERDPLTSAATRGFFFRFLSEQRSRDGIAIMIDIDFFKQVNDTYGHLAGDKVIAHVSQILLHEVRENDVVCRFGGEEFVIFLMGADAATGQEIAERIRACVEQSPIAVEGKTLQVTVSVGVSSITSAAEIEPAIQEADEALYRAKRAGRNRVAFGLAA